MVQWLAHVTTNPPTQVRSRPREVGAQLSQLFILPNGLVDKWAPGKSGYDKLWKLVYRSSPVSRGNRLIFTTVSKANVTGDERPHLRAATACSRTLPFTLHCSWTTAHTSHMKHNCFRITDLLVIGNLWRR